MKIAFLLLIWCVCSVVGYSQLNPPFDTIPSSYNINSPNPTLALDIPYDTDNPSRQAFHIFLPDTTGTYPLVIYIHGGGFTGSSRDVVFNRTAEIKYFLDRNIAYASIGYRLLPNPNTPATDSVGVIKCLNDAKRGLQFIRHHAAALHINPNQVAAYGGSAGGGTALWLATRSDMADPMATDPVLQQSTRLCAVAPQGSQSTYDLYRWETDVFNNFDGMGTTFTIDSAVALLTFLRYSNFYGGLDSNYHILHDPALIQYRQDVDMLYHMSSDDPPLWIRSPSGATHPAQDPLHHSFHGREIHNAALAAGISEVKADIPYLGINTTGGEGALEFLERHLNACSLVNTVEAVEERVETIRIYPNPTSSVLYLDTELQRPEWVIYNAMGQLVVQGNGKELQVSHLSKGMYVVKIESQVLKFIKE